MATAGILEVELVVAAVTTGGETALAPVVAAVTTGGETEAALVVVAVTTGGEPALAPVILAAGKEFNCVFIVVAKSIISVKYVFNDSLVNVDFIDTIKLLKAF